MKYFIAYFLIFYLSINSYTQLKIETDALSINTNSDEFGPSYFNDGILITSNRMGSILKTYVEVDDDGNEQFLNNVYFVKFKGSVDSVHNSIRPFHLKSENYHNGPTSISNNDLLVVARNLPSRSKKTTTRVGLYFYKKLGDKWIVDKPFEHNSRYYNLSHPTISPDGKTLYFVSNFKGGQGGMDIWKSTLKPNNRWTAPSNLGSGINTKANEVFPQLCDGVLYFSSNRSGGLGGYDIYYNTLESLEIHTLDEPINSTKDEYGLITNDNGHTGFFTTNRRNNNDDIFFFRRSIALPNDCQKSVKTKMCYTFYDKQPSTIGDKVAYIWDFGDGKKNIGQEVKHCYTEPGEYKISLSLYDSTSQFLTENSSSLSLKINKSSDYYLSYHEHTKDKDVDVVLVDATNRDTVHKPQDMYWKIGSEIIYDHDHVLIHPKYNGQYSINGYLKEKGNITCVTDTIMLEGYEKAKNKETYIHLIYKKDGMIFSDDIQEEVFTRLFDFPEQNNYLLTTPPNVSSEWIGKVKASFKSKFRENLEVLPQKGSKDIILKIYE